MDVTLLQNAPNIIEAIREESQWYTYEDIMRDPWNTFVYSHVGYSQTSVDNYLSSIETEIEAVIDFASTWDIDPNEYDFSDLEKKAQFAFFYIAYELQSDQEWEQEQEQELEAA
jgi:hypothetical protein